MVEPRFQRWLLVEAISWGVAPGLHDAVPLALKTNRGEEVFCLSSPLDSSKDSAGKSSFSLREKVRMRVSLRRS
jgi:hypothetical protein